MKYWIPGKEIICGNCPPCELGELLGEMCASGNQVACDYLNELQHQSLRRSGVFVQPTAEDDRWWHPWRYPSPESLRLAKTPYSERERKMLRGAGAILRDLSAFGQASPLPDVWFYLWHMPLPGSPYLFQGYLWGNVMQAGRVLSALRDSIVGAWRITDTNNHDVTPVGPPQFTPPVIPPFHIPGYAAAGGLPWLFPPSGSGTTEPPFWSKS